MEEFIELLNSFLMNEEISVETFRIKCEAQGKTENEIIALIQLGNIIKKKCRSKNGIIE